MVQELTEENFEKEVLQSDIPVIVDFWASWCGPCKMLAPEFDAVSEEAVYSGKLKFTKISTEDFPNIAQQNSITGIPCLIIFKDGKEVDRIVGFKQRDQLKQEIDGILGKV